jgi:hypothetical protein
MDMQDKNIDELFRAKLDVFEVEPSADVWPRIAVQIDLNRRTKRRMRYLGAAASVIVLLTAGVFFIPQKVKEAGKKNPARNMAKTATNLPAVKHEDILTGKIGRAVLTQRIVSRRDKKHNPVSAERIGPTIKIPDTGLKAQPVIASVPYREQVIEPVVPDIATQLAVKQSIAEAPNLGSKPNLVSAQLPARDNQHAGPVKTRHKIRGPGDLINVVVEKVDKRRDKIIEFTDDDDETNVTGINLGIIKIKKEK